MKLSKVLKIAVAVDSDGNWAAHGGSDVRFQDSMQSAELGLDVAPFKSLAVEVTVELPELIEMKKVDKTENVQGKVLEL